MPKKRPVEIRITEMESKMDDLKLEMEIKRLKERRAARGIGRRRSKRRNRV